MFISKTILSVIPDCPPEAGLSGLRLIENPSDLFGIVKKDAGQASMTEYLNACNFTYGLISN
jgi:hypothetical protein